MRRKPKASVVSIAVTIAATAAVTWTCMTFSVRVTGDALMVLPAGQAKECAEGGGCNVYSKREIQSLLEKQLRSMMEGAASPKPRHWDRTS